MGVVVDSSCLIAMERRLGKHSLTAQMLPDDEPCVSAISVAELRFGLELADEGHRADRAQFISTLTNLVTVLDFGLAETEAYGRIAAHLRRTGNTIGERDLMIAATAVAHGHDVMTLNTGEFERVPGLGLRTAPRPP